MAADWDELGIGSGLVPSRRVHPAPSVCRSVHYVDVNTVTGAVQCRAATVTKVWTQGDQELDVYRVMHEVAEIEPTFGTPNAEWVALHVMIVSGCVAMPFSCHDENDKAPGTWHWPERADR